MTTINIVPQPKVKICTTVKILSISVDIYQSATIQVSVCDEQDNVIQFEIVKMTGADYANWGNSDDYLENFILEKLGFTKQ